MRLLGLTGGVGMGKSACAELLQQRGVAVVDTDQIARQIVEPGQPALDEVRQAFGAEVFGSGGELRRDVLAQRVFSDPSARKQLEAILHPRIRRLWQEQIKDWRIRQLPLGVVVIPLLFETKAETEFDEVICVACSAETQLTRLRERGWSDLQIQQRIGAQWPVAEKIAKAKYVIWTEGSLAVHAAQLDLILGTYA